ncbi:MAG: hypothetical protein C4304_06885 [candidate division GAL15 bacterium]
MTPRGPGASMERDAAKARYRPVRAQWWSSLPGSCPVTWTWIGANTATFLASFVGLDLALSFSPSAVAARPWTVLTYALDGSGSVISLVLSAYVLWVFGGSLERSWLPRDYVRFLLLTTPTPAMALWLAAAWLNQGVALSGLWLPVAACSVAWSVLNPHERLLLYLAVPVEGRWVGPLAAAVVFFSFPFPLGVFALAGCALSWAYASGQFGGRAPLRGLGPVEAYRRWRRKREFQRLMRRSGLH